MKRLTVFAAVSLIALPAFTADARPIGNPRNLSSKAPAAVRDPGKRAGLLGHLFRKDTAPPKDSRIAPRRGKRTPGAATATTPKRTGSSKKTLFGILFGK